jgi:hypothetical protein
MDIATAPCYYGQGGQISLQHPVITDRVGRYSYSTLILRTGWTDIATVPCPSVSADGESGQISLQYPALSDIVDRYRYSSLPFRTLWTDIATVPCSLQYPALLLVRTDGRATLDPMIYRLCRQSEGRSVTGPVCVSESAPLQRTAVRRRSWATKTTFMAASLSI